MKNQTESGLDVLKKAREFRALGFITTILIIAIYHNFFSEELSRINFFGILLILFVLLATSTSDKSGKIRHKISKMEGIKDIKNPHQMVDFLNTFDDPQLIQLKKKLISIYYESSFVLGFCISFVFSMFTYFIKG